MSRGGSNHRIRGLFERAVSNDMLCSSVVLWRCYIGYELNIAHDPSAARRIFFRAIHACPWWGLVFKISYCPQSFKAIREEQMCFFVAIASCCCCYYYHLIYLCKCVYQVKTAMVGWISQAKLHPYWKRAFWSTRSNAW